MATAARTITYPDYDLVAGSGYITLIFAASGTSNTTYSNRFFPCFGGLVANTTESAVWATIPYRLRVKKVIAKMNANGQDQATTIRLRDDGADVTGTTLTMPASSTIEQISSDIDTIIEAGSKINWRFDNSTVTSGGWVLAHCYALCQIEPI